MRRGMRVIEARGDRPMKQAMSIGTYDLPDYSGSPMSHFEPDFSRGALFKYGNMGNLGQEFEEIPPGNGERISLDDFETTVLSELMKKPAYRDAVALRERLLAKANAAAVALRIDKEKPILTPDERAELRSLQFEYQDRVTVLGKYIQPLYEKVALETKRILVAKGYDCTWPNAPAYLQGLGNMSSVIVTVVVVAAIIAIASYTGVLEDLRRMLATVLRFDVDKSKGLDALVGKIKADAPPGEALAALKAYAKAYAGGIGTWFTAAAVIAVAIAAIIIVPKLIKKKPAARPALAPVPRRPKEKIITEKY